MKIYYTLREGGNWHYRNISRKAINTILRLGVLYSVQGNLLQFSAIRIGKSPMIYDFVLLKLNKQPWIRNLPNSFK